MRRWIMQVLIALDQLCTAILGGWADETLSSYAHRMYMQGKPWGVIWRNVIDYLFLILFGQPEHCLAAYTAERERAQLPPELRDSRQPGATP